MNLRSADILRAARTLWDGALTLALALLASGMVLLAAAQIVLRNVFRTGIVGVEAVLGMALLWLTMLGALAATGARRHITIDVATHLMPQRPRALLGSLTSLFAAAVCVLLTIAAARYCSFQREIDALTTLLGRPLWSFYLVIPICLGLMSIRFLAQAIRSLSAIRAPGAKGAP